METSCSSVGLSCSVDGSWSDLEGNHHDSCHGDLVSYHWGWVSSDACLSFVLMSLVHWFIVSGHSFWASDWLRGMSTHGDLLGWWQQYKWRSDLHSHRLVMY